MKTMMVPADRRAEAIGWRTIPAAAGIIYALAWANGLLIAPASLRVTASGTEVVSAYAGHQARPSPRPFSPRAWPGSPWRWWSWR